jgi:hypothetical protein
VLALTWLPAFVNLHGQSLSSLLAKTDSSTYNITQIV